MLSNESMPFSFFSTTGMRPRKANIKSRIILLLCGLICSSCSAKKSASSTPTYRCEIVRAYTHRREAFTQGLVFHEGFLYEGTGTYGASTLEKIDLSTNAVLKRLRLPNHLWGEGITILGERLYQLTYKSRIGFVYDTASFNLIKKFNYPGEGWGITHNGRELIMSDGSATLRFMDPNTLQTTRSLEIRTQHGPMKNLNELEYIDGTIYANIWLTNLIAMISPETGQVTGMIYLNNLTPNNSQADVLNGIAYDSEKRRLFVTGKYWATLYEIKLIRN
jgi:glutaminyl-peptide cyclotransferase